MFVSHTPLALLFLLSGTEVWISILISNKFSFLNLLQFCTYSPSISGVRCEVVLTQTGSELKRPGESLTLSCKVSGFTFSSSYYLNWIRQPPGKGLEWLTIIRGDNGYTNYNDAIKGRFSVSIDSSSSVTKLQMNSLRSEDTAVYYCANSTQLV
ncbi:HV323 protein, partial [Atractosteus spatula]|nr:HV323 protein [Atractosteus spatula]